MPQWSELMSSINEEDSDGDGAVQKWIVDRYTSVVLFVVASFLDKLRFSVHTNNMHLVQIDPLGVQVHTFSFWNLEDTYK